MDWLIKRAGKIVLGIWGLFLVPIVLDLLKIWIKKWPGYDDPVGTFGTVSDVIGEIAHLWWVQWIFVFLTGLLVGQRLDRAGSTIFDRAISGISA
jgi:hypothetical protein